MVERFEKTDRVAAVGITGELDRSGSFSAGPWYTYDTPCSSLTKDAGGEYTAVLYDDKGIRLEAVGFDAADNFRVTTREGTFSPGSDIIPIDIIVRFDRETARIAINKGDMEIYSRSVSKQAPAVAFKEVSENRINWEASSEDGKELWFRLWYCTDNGGYHHLATDIQGDSFEADLTGYPGSKSGCFHIYATDGVRTAEAKSPPVRVQHAAPDFLTVQKETPKIKITDEIYFKAEIHDKQDGKLTGDSVIWVLNGEEAAKTAALQTRPYQLEPGLHTFTCIATNSGGASARRDYTFEIVDDESELPDDWSRSEIVQALKKGYTIPLVRMEAPIPRGEFMGLVSRLFGTKIPEDIPEPHKSLTQREAFELIKNNTYDANGIFDKTNNIYQPEEKLSKKSALVWISRIDNTLKR